MRERRNRGSSYDQFLDATRSALIEFKGLDKGERLFGLGMALEDPVEQLEFFKALLADIQNRAAGRPATALLDRTIYRHRPVPIRKFLLDEYYLNLSTTIYPTILPEMEELNSGDYVEAVLTGGIGVAKTTMALWTIAYQVYLLSCMTDPHRVFGLDRSSEILFVFQSITTALAKEASYNRFRALIESSPYFQKHFPHDRKLESTLKFPRRIECRPIAGVESGAIGQNVIGGIIDEMNFMQVVERSKQDADGGTYDQAMALYTTIARRRKSRFMKDGKLPGILCLVSSKRYPGQFTDLKTEESQREIELFGRTSIYVYDRKIWEVKPNSYGSERFDVFIGDQSRQPRILGEGANRQGIEEHLILPVPMEFRLDFEQDITKALRDIGGVSTLTRHPFIMNRERLNKCFGGVESVLSLDQSDLVSTVITILKENIKNPHEPRWVHFDLSLTGDATGLAIGHVPRFADVHRGDIIETLPMIQFDCMLRVVNPQGGEIEYHRIRSLLFKLIEAGIPIKWASADSFQSADHLQQLKRTGFSVGYISTDTSTLPYDMAKSAFYDGRVRAPKHEVAQLEWVTLEKDSKRGKIDHPPSGSKDISDAMASVIYGLSTRRETWIRHEIDMTNLPETISAALKRESAKAQSSD